MKPPNIWRIFSSLFSVCNQVKERRTVIFLVRVATQSIPKKKGEKNPAGLIALRDEMV